MDELEDIEAAMQAASDELAAKRKERRKRELAAIAVEHREWLMSPEKFLVVYCDETDLDLPGVVILKPGGESDISRWKQQGVHQPDPETKVIAYSVLAMSCCLYPEKPTLRKMFERHGMLPEALCGPVLSASQGAAVARGK